MEDESAPRFSKEDRAAARATYLRALDALREDTDLALADERFLLSQSPSGIDDENRVVLEFVTSAALAAAAKSPALTKLARTLRSHGLAAGLKWKPLSPGLNNRPATANRLRPGLPQQQLLFLPSFLVTVTLPHRQVSGSEFTRVNGDIRLSLLANADPGLPHGVYPRLALMHLTTLAVRRQDRAFFVGESANDFLRLMGIGNTGGATGASTRARDQLRRLCRTTFAYENRNKTEESWSGLLITENFWASQSGRGLYVTLTESFYRLARTGAVPLDAGIVADLRRSPLALDTYAWLTHRVSRLKKDTLIPWRSLEAQFGAEYTHARNFRVKFRRSLLTVQQLWPGVRAEPQDRGVLIYPCAPSVLSWLERAATRGGMPLSGISPE